MKINVSDLTAVTVDGKNVGDLAAAVSMDAPLPIAVAQQLAGEREEAKTMLANFVEATGKANAATLAALTAAVTQAQSDFAAAAAAAASFNADRERALLEAQHAALTAKLAALG